MDEFTGMRTKIMKNKNRNQDPLLNPNLSPNNYDISIEEWASKPIHIKSKPHLIENLLPDAPGAYGIIAGRTGIGKTNSALDLGFCLATSEPWFDLQCKKVKVKMIASKGGVENKLVTFNPKMCMFK